MANVWLHLLGIKQGIYHHKSALYDVRLKVYPNATLQNVIAALKTAQENSLAGSVKKCLGAIGTQSMVSSFQGNQTIYI